MYDWKNIERKMQMSKADSFLERVSNANQGIRLPTEVSSRRHLTQFSEPFVHSSSTDRPVAEKVCPQLRS